MGVIEKELNFYSDLKQKVENSGIKIIPVKVIEDQNDKACVGDIAEIESEIKESLKYFSKEVQLQKIYQIVDDKSEYFIKKPFFIKEWCEDEQNSHYFKKNIHCY